MDINEKDIVVLDDNNKYEVLMKVEYNNKKYYYIYDILKNDNVKFLCEEGNQLVEIDDKETFNQVLTLMIGKVDMDDFLEDMKRRLEENNANENN